MPLSFWPSVMSMMKPTSILDMSSISRMGVTRAIPASLRRVFFKVLIIRLLLFVLVEISERANRDLRREIRAQIANLVSCRCGGRVGTRSQIDRYVANLVFRIAGWHCRLIRQHSSAVHKVVGK